MKYANENEIEDIVKTTAVIFDSSAGSKFYLATFQDEKGVGDNFLIDNNLGLYTNTLNFGLLKLYTDPLCETEYTGTALKYFFYNNNVYKYDINSPVNFNDKVKNVFEKCENATCTAANADECSLYGSSHKHFSVKFTPGIKVKSIETTDVVLSSKDTESQCYIYYGIESFTNAGNKHK